MPPTIRLAAACLLVTVPACSDGAGPDSEAGNVDAMIGANVMETDTGLVVPGAWHLRVPSNHEALWLDWFFHHEFGGFPELDYEQNTRFSESWRIQLTHEKDRVTRNDSTILSFVDHGDAAVESVTMEKLTTVPHVTPGLAIRFENWVRYLTHSYLEVTWLPGHTETFHHQAYHQRLLAGEPIRVTTTGSQDAEAVTATFSAAPMARLLELQSGDALVGLNADAAPVLRTDRPLIFQFDRALDHERSYIVFIPWPNQGGGAERAFIRLRSSVDRVVIPSSVLADLVESAAQERVAYLVVVEEYHWEDDVFSGRLATGEPFTLPFVQEGETSLLVYLER